MVDAVTYMRAIVQAPSTCMSANPTLCTHSSHPTQAAAPAAHTHTSHQPLHIQRVVHVQLAVQHVLPNLYHLSHPWVTRVPPPAPLLYRHHEQLRRSLHLPRHVHCVHAGHALGLGVRLKVQEGVGLGVRQGACRAPGICMCLCTFVHIRVVRDRHVHILTYTHIYSHLKHTQSGLL